MHIRLRTFLLLVSPLLLSVVVAYVQWGTVGLPALPLASEFTPKRPPKPWNELLECLASRSEAIKKAS